MHESSFGTQGVARFSLSLGNLRCISNFKYLDGYAWFPTWESGFKAWYSLIRTLYVSEWKLTTVSQIIPKYAPAADNNDEAAYEEIPDNLPFPERSFKHGIIIIARLFQPLIGIMGVAGTPRSKLFDKSVGRDALFRQALPARLYIQLRHRTAPLPGLY
jgi:hypothetical protein